MFSNLKTRLMLLNVVSPPPHGTARRWVKGACQKTQPGGYIKLGFTAKLPERLYWKHAKKSNLKVESTKEGIRDSGKGNEWRN